MGGWRNPDYEGTCRMSPEPSTTVKNTCLTAGIGTFISAHVTNVEEDGSSSRRVLVYDGLPGPRASTCQPGNTQLDDTFPGSSGASEAINVRLRHDCCAKTGSISNATRKQIEPGFKWALSAGRETKQWVPKSVPKT